MRDKLFISNPMTASISDVGAIATGYGKPEKADVQAFVKCAATGRYDKLATDYLVLFGLARFNEYGQLDNPLQTINAYMDFAEVLNDGMALLACAQGHTSLKSLGCINLDELAKAYDIFDVKQVASVYLQSAKTVPFYGELIENNGYLRYTKRLHSPEGQYLDFIKDGVARLKMLVNVNVGQQLAAIMAEENGNALMVYSNNVNPMGLFDRLATIHSADMIPLYQGGSIRFASTSLASAIWQTATDAGEVKICGYKKCGKPFVASGKQKDNAVYCSNSCKTLASRARNGKKEAIPAPTRA